jgi:uncharacterized membrane protein YgcG
MAAIGRPRRRGIDLAPDDPIVRRIEDALTSTQVDPLYRRQLRSAVVNRYVALREGHLAGRAAARPLAHHGVMGRLGRACLYASVALAGSAAGVLAASQTALPGDVLYDVKLRIDALRLETAPADLRTAVAEYIVGERLDELTVLAADGEWARAAEAAEAAGAQTQMLAALLEADPAAEARIHRHLEVLAGLLATAPPAARDALAHAMAVSGTALGPAQADAPQGQGGSADGAGSGNGSGGNGNGNGAANGSNGGSAGGEDPPDASPSASAAPSASADDAGKKDDPKGDGGNADAPDPDEAEAPAPTPRASRPPQASHGNP